MVNLLRSNRSQIHACSLVLKKRKKINLDRNCAKSAGTQCSYTSSSSSEHCLNVSTLGQQAGQSREGIPKFGCKSKSYKY